jgi:ABC-type polysaccharide/polyol phosphate transport system ATPase subunit
VKPILEVQNISKQFKIYHEGSSYLTFRERISGLFARRDKREDFWALKDISFQVKQGESIGIIGRNGAGKSTLLKILSRITPPSTGRIISRGRIASLLEVGTGFHFELTGKENIYMNGSILGMRKSEIDAQFDQIVDFSGVEKFLDTPLKHYSSGMQLRLAFAVAAHLEPEILIVDEVLAVGDASFQRKCFQKMEDINSHGRTILFVSHNLSQVNQLCTGGILLDQGKVIFQGNVHDTIAAYISNNIRENEIDVSSLPRAGVKSDELSIRSLKLVNVSNDLKIKEGSQISFAIDFQAHKPVSELIIGFSLTDFNGTTVVECRSSALNRKLDVAAGAYKATVEFKPNLAPGTYNLNLGARSHKGHIEYIPSVVTIDILPEKEEEEWSRASAGILVVHSEWEIKKK